MSNRDDYLAAIDSLVGGTLPLTDGDKILAVNQAVKRYSKDKPRVVVVDIDGDGGFDYAVSLLTSWADDFSVIKQVEYPVDDTVEHADILQTDAWAMYEKPTGKCLRFLAIKPLATEDMRITYTALHTCTDSASTIAGFDEEAVQALCAAFFCEMLAAYYAQSQDATIAADSVDHTSRSREYAARAKTYRQLYFRHLGIKEGQAPPASVTQDQDRPGSWGRDHITHPRKYR